MVIFYCFNVLKKCKRPTISVSERAIIPYLQVFSGPYIPYKDKIFDLLIRENAVFWHISNSRTQTGLTSK